MKQEKIIRVEQNKDSPLYLTWIINNICTNQCSYCPTLLHNGTNHNYSWDNAKKFFKLLFERYPKIHCSVAGGEPSVSPFFPEFVEIFRKNNSTIGLTSNAAKTVKYWERLAPDLQYICFSWHSEFIDKDFDEKVKVASRHTPVTVRIMMHPAHWEKCVEKFNSYKKQNSVFFEAVRIHYWGGGSDLNASIYTNDQLQWFKENDNDTFKSIIPNYNKPPLVMGASFYFNNGEVIEYGNTLKYINNGLTNFNGYNCAIGLRSLFIDHQGRIQRGNCSVGGFIGNINDSDNIQWPTEPVKCNINLCHCTTDVEIDKWI
jgi:organic radical activating enzyme